MQKQENGLEVSFSFLMKSARVLKNKILIATEAITSASYLSVEIGSLHTLLLEDTRQCMLKTIKLFITINPMIPFLETYLRK